MIEKRARFFGSSAVDGKRLKYIKVYLKLEVLENSLDEVKRITSYYPKVVLNAFKRKILKLTNYLFSQSKSGLTTFNYCKKTIFV